MANAPAVHGLIEIKSTDEGDEISITGAYAGRLQVGAFAALRLLNVFAEKIAASGQAGHSASAPLHETIPRPRREIPRYHQPTDFGELHTH